MSIYNQSNSSCFAENSTVALATGTGSDDGDEKVIAIRKLRPNIMVLTLRGPRKVITVLKTLVKEKRLRLVDRVLITPWHPVLLSQEKGWVFPIYITKREEEYTGSIYSVLLQRDRDINAHTIKVGGLWGVTLGHRMIEQTETGDVRAHQFFGNYDRVVKALGRL